MNALVDFYVYAAIRTDFRSKYLPKVHLVVSGILLAMILACVILMTRTAYIYVVMWLLISYLSVYIIKYLFLVFDVISRLPIIFGGKRLKWLPWVGFGFGTLVFIIIWWGILFCRNMIDVNQVELEIPGLPHSFNGTKIVQISDLHVGTWQSDTNFVSKVVDAVNDLNPDIVVFTGDLVNSRADELVPFMPVLSRIKASNGVYSIMGNHDYGDYYRWKDDNQKAENENLLKQLQGKIGWKMLNNDHDFIAKGNDTIVMIGVENIGEPPFKTHGNLKKAYSDVDDDKTKILLSHNPRHWTDSISGNPNTNIALTLSGHTHAMQIEVFGYSPAVFKYPTWKGLFTDSKGQNLYVNIGVGEVGLPMRIGAIPEITVFTLKSVK